MYAKIENGELLYVTTQLPKKQIEKETENENGEIETEMIEVDNMEWFIELTRDENEILSRWWIYKNWKFLEKEKNLEQKIKDINEEFDKKINKYLSKYPKREQDTFAEKKSEAEKVLAGWESIYIAWKAKALEITPEQFAKIIIAKNNEWTALYTELENEKDLQVMQLEAQILALKTNENGNN